MSKSVLELQAASFGYVERGAARTVIHEVNLRVGRGDVVGIVGANGSGKSTLVKGILGLSQCLAGELQLFGTPAKQFRDRARIGYVPQLYSVSGSVRTTVAEVARTGRLARRRWWRPESDDDRRSVSHALELVGLNAVAHSDIARLSGGQQRRMLIARALAGEPELLILDEPTGGVDGTGQTELAAVWRRLAAEGHTLLIVTHDLAGLSEVLTRVLTIEHGRAA